MNNMYETERLIIRKIRMEDAKRLYENHMEEEVKQWIPNESYVDMEETQNAIRFYIDCVNQKRMPYVLAVTLKATGELIGDTGVNEVEITPLWEFWKRMVIFLRERNSAQKMTPMEMEC